MHMAIKKEGAVQRKKIQLPRISVHFWLTDCDFPKKSCGVDGSWKFSEWNEKEKFK